MRALLIAEKPSLMRTIKAVYDKHKSEFDFDIDFTAQVGHLFGLKLPKEINPEKYGKWTLSAYPEVYPYEYKMTNAKVFKDVKDKYKANKYDFIINAGDPDQEGEILIRETLQKLNNKLPVKRYWSNDTTDGAVLNALKNLEDDKEYDRFYHAALVRQHADYQFGMNTTGAITCKMGDLCKTGRVKAAIISMVSQREIEIRNYVEKKTYKPAFTYKNAVFILDKVFDTPEEAMKCVPNVDNADVISSEYKKKLIKAPKLYKIATIQTDASKIFGWSSNKTSDILQSLYEKKAVSYPRTDCEYISSKVDLDKIGKKVLTEVDVDKNLLTKSTKEIAGDKTYCNDKAIATEGHTGIIPTGEGLRSNNAEERALYELICRRFLAIFASEKETMNVKVVANPDTTKDPYTFTETYDLTKGYEEILNPGYKMRESIGVKFDKGDNLKPIEFMAKELVSQKPSRYTDGSLIAAMDKLTYVDENGEKIKYSIGTPATRANIIAECQANGYFTVEKKSFVATEKALAVYESFKDVPLFNVIESGKWESKLEGIRVGEKDPKAVEDELIAAMENSVEQIKNAKLTTYDVEKKGGKSGAHSPSCTCPACGGAVKKGQYGLYCSAKCGMTFGKVYGNALTEKQWIDAINGKPVHLKGLTSKAGKKYNVKYTPNGIDNYSYTGKDGKTHEGKQIHFESEFEK